MRATHQGPLSKRNTRQACTPPDSLVLQDWRGGSGPRAPVAQAEDLSLDPSPHTVAHTLTKSNLGEGRT